MIGGQLQLGLNHPLHIRQVHLSAQRETCRLMYVSDIHLRRGRSERLSGQILDAVLASRADAVILGGDLADSSSVLHHLTSLVDQLSKIAPVFAIGGNHNDLVELIWFVMLSSVVEVIGYIRDSRGSSTALV